LRRGGTEWNVPLRGKRGPTGCHQFPPILDGKAFSTEAKGNTVRGYRNRGDSLRVVEKERKEKKVVLGPLALK